MNDADLAQIGVNTEKKSKMTGPAEDALRACPALPKDLYKTITRIWAPDTYIIYSNKEKRGVCTRCGHVLGTRHFPVYSYLSERHRILKQRVQAGLDPLDCYEMDTEDGVEPLAEDDPAVAAAVNRDFAALKTKDPDPAFSRLITAHGTKYTCPHCREEAILLESGRGRAKYESEMIITIPLVSRGKIYVLNLWTDLDYSPYGRPKAVHELRSLYVFSPDGNEYYYKSWKYGTGTIFVQSDVSRKTVHIPLPPSPMGYYPSRRSHICFYSAGISEKLGKTDAWKYAKWLELCYWVDQNKNSGYRCFSDLFLKYIFFYSRDPAVERLEQSGFTHLVYEYILNNGDIKALDWKKNTLTEIFRLPVETVREIRSAGFGLNIIGTYKKLRGLEGRRPRVTLAQARVIDRGKNGGLAKTISEFEKTGIPFAGFLDYQRRQCAKASGEKQYWIGISDYKDYIGQCQQLNLDLTAHDVMYPKNFDVAHTRLSDIISARNDVKEAKELAKYAAKIKEAGEKIARRSAPYLADGLLIRPAVDAMEISREGRLQHHCVASYWKGMARGEYAIMFIRKEADPDTPYFTLQLMKSGVVNQNRGKYNCSVPDDVRAFVDKWLAEVINKPEKKKKPAARSSAQPVQLAAAI